LVRVPGATRNCKLRSVKDPVNPDLLGALCHELRGPLGAIGNWIHVLSSDAADRDARSRALNGITGDVRAMGRLLERLSSVATALSGRESTVRAVDLVSLLKEELTLDGLTLRLESPEPSILVLADRIRLLELVRLLFPRETVEGAAPPSRTISITNHEMTELRIAPLATSRFSRALAREIMASLGGACIESTREGVAVLTLTFRRAA
jgi:hypothetical protein